MGHSYIKHSGGTIENYEPDNDENHLYIEASYGLSLTTLLERIKNHFGQDIDFEDLEISSEHIHTRCLGYDLYDSGDYDEYICIRKI